MPDNVDVCAIWPYTAEYLVCRLWHIPDGVATLVAGSFAIIGAVVAWLTVQRQINASERMERERHRAAVRGTAAALAGEMQAYLDLLQPEQTLSYWRTMASMPHGERIRLLTMVTQLPSGHPVFDSVADRIGDFPMDTARSVSRFYNVITGFRLLYSHVNSAGFLAADGDLHRAYIVSLAERFEKELPNLRAIIASVETVAGDIKT